jgi:hypothetical protein
MRCYDARLIDDALRDPSTFRATLRGIAPASRDQWVDRVLGFGELPDDGPDLPRGCAPYLPCSVDVLLRAVVRARVTRSDIFVDVGSGVGRAMSFVHLATGAGAMGIEVQGQLARASKDLAARSALRRVSTVEGDAIALAGLMATGSVFFFYCPFSGDRLKGVLDDLEAIARTRMLRLCFVDVAVPERAWLVREPRTAGDSLVICRTSLHDRRLGRAALRNARAVAAIG